MKTTQRQQKSTQSQPAAQQRKGTASLESPQGEQLAQLEAMAESSPQADRMARLAATVNNSPQAIAQRRMMDMIHDNPRMAAQCKAVAAVRGSPHVTAQRQRLDSLAGETVQREEAEETLQPQVAQREEAPDEPNDTGLPDNLKSGIDTLSGISMDNVRVHYNSSQPVQINAHAYAQGTDIHVASGQEQHLPHEAWHFVQQAQGRVQPTMQMKQGGPVNDDKSLEHEADMMGDEVLRVTQRQKTISDPIALTQVQRISQFQTKAGNFDPHLQVGSRQVIQQVPEDFKDHPIQDIAARTGMFRTSYWSGLQTAIDEYSELKEDNIKERRAKLREIGSMVERWLTARGIRDDKTRENLNETEKEKYDAIEELLKKLEEEMKSSQGKLSVDAPNLKDVLHEPQLTKTREESDGRKRGYTKKDLKVLNVHGTPTGSTIPAETVCRVEVKKEGPTGKNARDYYWIRKAPNSDNEWGNVLNFTPGYALREDLITTGLEKRVPDLAYESRQNTTLFPLFQGPPTIDDVQQVGLGDCYLLAAVLTIVRKEPDFFPSIMKDHGNGIVSVKLYDVDDSNKENKKFTPKIIHIKKTAVVNTNYKTSLKGGYNQGALWVEMLEKAYAAGGYRGTTHEKLPAKQTSWAEISGGFPRIALEIITGRASDEIIMGDNALGEMSEGKTWVSTSQDFKVMTQDKGVIDGKDYFQKVYMDGELKDFEKALIKLSEENDQVRLHDVFGILDKISDNNLRARVKEFIEKKKLYPDKRGTGIYSRYQIDTFTAIAEAIDAGKKVVLSTNQSMKRKGGSQSGQSAGEHVHKGLAGPHAYEAFAYSPSDYTKKPGKSILMWVKIRNPWGKTGRLYKDGMYGIDQPGGMERVPMGGLKASDNTTEDAEFWIPLADLTKRFHRRTTQAPKPPVIRYQARQVVYPQILESGKKYMDSMGDLLSAVKELAEDRGVAEFSAKLQQVVQTGIPFKSESEMIRALKNALEEKKANVATAIVDYIMDCCE